MRPPRARLRPLRTPAVVPTTRASVYRGWVCCSAVDAVKGLVATARATSTVIKYAHHVKLRSNSVAIEKSSPNTERKAEILFRRFKGIVCDSSRPYNYSIMLHLCFDHSVPAEARARYICMKPNTLQETIRKRVIIESEIAAHFGAMKYFHARLSKWHIAVDRHCHILPSDVVQAEFNKLLRRRSKVQATATKIKKAALSASALQDKDYMIYSELLLEGLRPVLYFCDAFGETYAPWILSVSAVNRLCKANIGIMGVRPEEKQQRRARVVSLGPFALQPCPELSASIALRYPPKHYTAPAKIRGRDCSNSTPQLSERGSNKAVSSAMGSKHFLSSGAPVFD